MLDAVALCYLGDLRPTLSFCYLGDDEDRGDVGKYPVFTETIRGRRRSTLEEGHWMGKMGSTVSTTD